MAPQKIELSRLEPGLAAALLVGCERLDPSGLCSAADLLPMAQAGQCFAATAEKAQAVYIVQVQNGVAWISATKGAGPVDWSALLLPVIEAQAAGAAAVGFQTARRGLVRKAQKQGYEVTGWILKKPLS